MTLVYLLIALPVALTFGNENDGILEIHKTRESLLFDGICDEALWEQADLFPMAMFRPNHGQEVSERSEIFVTFDDDYLYLGARLYYENGANLTVTTKKRDGADGGSDNFGILLDTFNDNENALCFETNPSGLRSDFTIANDMQTILGLSPFNRSWNTFWDVKTSVLETTWHVEMRIPLSSLRFQEKNGEISMGMSIWRSIVSKQEWNVFPLITNGFGMFGIWKPSQSQKVILRGIKRKNPIYITPYVLGGLEQTSQLNGANTEYTLHNDTKFNAGLDVKYALTSNITMDLTFNTDFAQVEADDQMVNLTRFSLFFPEKRQFFLERNSIFTIRTGVLDQLFYSRRIGLDDGEIIPIIGGARLVGRVGKYDLGFMDMQTNAYEYTDNDTDSLTSISSTNYGVLRLRKQVFNKTSYAGGMVTSKIDANGTYNVNTALDLIYNPFRNDFFTANYTQTFDDDNPASNQFYNNGKLYLNWQNRSNVGFSYEFMFARAGEFYNPEMGFELMDNYTRGYSSLNYGWVYNQIDKKILSQEIKLQGNVNKRNEDFTTDISNLSLNYGISMKNGYRAGLEIMGNHEYLTEQFDLSDDMYFPTGSYDYLTLEGIFSTPANNLFSLQASARIGSYYDGNMMNFGPAAITYRPSATVKLALDYQYSQIDVAEREQFFKAHLARLKTELTFTTKLSLLMFFQYSSIDNFGVNNVRFRYNPKEGNDLYLVFNGSYNTNLLREYPNLPVIDQNTFILKYNYTFVWEK